MLIGTTRKLDVSDDDTQKTEILVQVIEDGIWKTTGSGAEVEGLTFDGQKHTLLGGRMEKVLI